MKYHREYRAVFEDLYKRLAELKPDLIVNTGDSAHTKTQISPEFVEMMSEHLQRTAEIAPYHLILGNHDLNLMNSDRQDAITPIVESINNPEIHLHKKSGRIILPPQDINEARTVNLWVFGIGDQDNYPKPTDWGQCEDDLNIGLFHGSIKSCITDSNWRMTHTEHDISIFEGLDYVLMGDIHKQQFLDPAGKIGYAGSLIQQNFGEDVDKGLLVWDILNKREHKTFPVYLHGSRKFYTLRLTDELLIPDVQIDEDSRVRIAPPMAMTLVQQKEIEKQVKRRFKPYDVITLSAVNIGGQSATIGKRTVDIENLRQLPIQDRLIRDFLKGRVNNQVMMDRILELNRKYQVSFDQTDETSRNVSWRINSIAWGNLFNYGENNVVDFNNIKGLTGIFAPNGKGKSNFIDVLMETCFDKVTKGISKNIFLINDNKEAATMIADLTAEDKNFVIERTIERLKYGQRKFEKEKEWGKTTCNFYELDTAGGKELLNDTLRPGTERSIRSKLGNFEDFMLTGFCSQWNTMDIIACRETDRKKILFKFLDLDIFEQKGLMARDESKEWYKRLQILEGDGIEEQAARYKRRIEELQNEIWTAEEAMRSTKEQIAELEKQTIELTSQKVKVDCDIDPVKTLSREQKAEQELKSLQAAIAQKQKDILNGEQLLGSKIPAPWDKTELQATRAELSTLQKELGGIQREREKAEQQYSQHRKSVVLLKEVPCGDEYPQCKFLVNAFDSQKKLPIWSDELNELRKKEQKLVDHVEGCQKRVEEFEQLEKQEQQREKWEAALSNAKLQLENLRLKVKGTEDAITQAQADRARYDQAASDIRKNRELDMEIAGLIKDKNALMADERNGQETLLQLSSDRGSQTGILEKLSESLAKLQEVRNVCTAFEHYIFAMGKDGIAYQILTQKLPLINDEINKVLLNAADFGVQIEHDPEEQSIRIYLQYGEYKPRLLELGGGAEKMLASIAIRTALLSISNLPKTNMFIIDEGFGKLDPEKMESVNRMFDYLKTVFEHVIVISHIDTMKDMVDNIIEITTDDEGYSHIEV